MKCRSYCGACCIAISIERPYYGMSEGKKAGEPCVHLDGNMNCRLYGDLRRPGLCEAFKPQHLYCGDNREQALLRLAELERATMPPAPHRCAT